MSDITPRSPRNAPIDLSSLKGLAHPLRVRILDTLSVYGAFTASGLAERLGESSGATSYHLRQLEKHGFVREDATRGSRRERWWERVPQGITVDDTYPALSAERAASELIVREWQASRDAFLSDYLAHGADHLDRRWTEAGTVDTANLRLTSDQLAGLVEDMQGVIERYRAAAAATPAASGSRPVQIQLNAFAVMDAEETP